MQANEFLIRPFFNPSGKKVFRVTGWLNGKRIRENHSSEQHAVTAKQDYERAALNMAPLPAITTRLTADQAAEAEACFQRIAGRPFTLTQAIDYTLLNFSPAQKTITVGAALDIFIKSKKDGNRRDNTIRSLENRLKAFKKDFNNRLISDIQSDALRPLIFRKESSAVNQDNDYRALTNFFNWAMKQKYCDKSPMVNIDKIRLDRNEPQILSLNEVRALIYATQTYKSGILMPYVTLALFCAIRPTEISRLTWDDIDLEDKAVTINAKIAKMRGRRIVAISDNAVEFLLTHHSEKTPLVGTNWRKDFDAVKLAAGFGSQDKEHNDHILANCHCKECYPLKPWTPDVLRHTGISHHLALHEHEGKTAAWAGNSPDVIQRHYKGLVKQKESADFWEIRPQKPAKILPMQRAA